MRSATILLDCGQIQGRRSDELRNFDPLSIDVSELDAVVLSHAHIDHSGRIPWLVKQGYTGPIYCHAATSDLCEIMLLDSGAIQEREVERENRHRSKRRQTVLTPLYTKADALACLPQFEPLEYGEVCEILPDVWVRLSDAGHILGAAIVELWQESGEHSAKLVFSGDLGFAAAPVMRDPARIFDADLVLLESTYGDRCHRDPEDTLVELGAIIGDARENGGNLLIPAFAVGRTQDLLHLLAENYERWKLSDWYIFLDSPMAIRTTQVYSQHDDLYDAPLFDQRLLDKHLPNLVLTETTAESQRINQIRSGAIIIAGSGMCTGGRIQHHLRHNISREESHILIVGFQAIGTLGRELVDGAEQVRIWGKNYPVRAHVHTVGGLSAHADQPELLNWYGNFANTPPVALVHGEPGAQTILRDALTSRFGANVSIPERGESLLVEPHKQASTSMLGR